jgi:YgiT-type zinc finger domain-containing protein
MDFIAKLPDGRQHIVKDLIGKVCNKCGEGVYSQRESIRIEKETLRATGVLSPEEIEIFVKMIGLTESEICNHLGLGAKTIYRWRRGAQRPSKSLSILLALVAHNTNLLQWITDEGWRDTHINRHTTKNVTSKLSNNRLFEPFFQTEEEVQKGFKALDSRDIIRIRAEKIFDPTKVWSLAK